MNDRHTNVTSRSLMSDLQRSDPPFQIEVEGEFHSRTSRKYRWLLCLQMRLSFLGSSISLDRQSYNNVYRWQLAYNTKLCSHLEIVKQTIFEWIKKIPLKNYAYG